MVVTNFKKFFRRKGKFVRQPREENKSFRQRDEKKGKSNQKCFRCGDPNHLIGDCPKPSRNKDQKAFIGGSWSDSKNDAEDKTNDETCLMAQSSNEVALNSSHYSDNASSLDNDSSSIIAIRTDHGREFDNEVQFGAYCDAQGITHNFSAPRTPQSNGVVERKNRTLQEMSRTMLNEQSIPQKFWCNAVDTEEEAIKRNTKVVNNNNEEDESIEVDEIVNIKESKNHPLDKVIGNLNQRILGSQAQNHSNFFCFISTIGPKDVKEALKDKSWVVPMQEELN
ncbi:retrovirus-related pol polyprotein from transposon TNT 1-94 [Tanacetum coccineum]